jgi:hypothetical protein
MQKIRAVLSGMAIAAVFAGCSESPTSDTHLETGPRYDSGGTFGSGGRSVVPEDSVTTATSTTTTEVESEQGQGVNVGPGATLGSGG